MVSFADLRDAHPQSLTGTADAWARFSAQETRLRSRVVTDLAGPLRHAGWQGEAADAALTRMTSLHDEFELYAQMTRNLATMLDEAAGTFHRHQLHLRAAIDAATALGLTVGEDGRVAAAYVPQSALSDPGALEAQRRAAQNAGIYADLIASIVADADHSDRDFAAALRRLAPDAQGTDDLSWGASRDAAQNLVALAGLSSTSIPAAGTDPARAAAWWKTRTPGQRDLLLTAYPAAIGDLDGLPATDRDRANRMALHELIGDDLNQYEDPNDPEHVRLVNLLAALDNADYQNRPPLYLLGIDNQDTGHAVVAVGNPDTARHTAILVPGVSTALDGMRGQISRADAIQTAAQNLQNGDVSVVAWLGYDPPQLDETVVTAAGSSRAEAGAASLDSFTDGLHISHDAGPSHMTAIGHSYGSVVVGDAASGHRHLAVTDVVTAGSPGMDVAGASQLDVGARHVWAGAAVDDPIASPGTAIPYVGHDLQRAMAVGHQMEPHQPAFGGNVYHVDTPGHSGYWTPGSQSLNNQASVVAGLYGQVTLDYGKTP
jgi:hypothetical protein